MTESKAENQVDKQQIKKAINALLKYHSTSKEEQNNLLGNDTNIHLQFGLGQTEKSNMKPKRIPIPHSLYQNESSLEEASICIFVKDEKAKKLLQEIQSTELSTKSKHLQNIKKIIHLQKLRKNYKTYAQRLELVQEYDLFFVDDCILPMVGECLGKTFYKRKKQPIPLRLSWDVPVFIRDCLSSTFLILGGSCVSIRAGRTTMASEHIIDNCESIINHTVSNHISNKWSNVQTIHVKLTNSIALPVYKATLDISTSQDKEIVEQKEVDKKDNPIIQALHSMKKDDKRKKKREHVQENKKEGKKQRKDVEKGKKKQKK